MALQNQTAFLNHCRDKNLSINVVLSNGIKLPESKITSHDQFTIILNDPNQDNSRQQRDFLNDCVSNNEIVSISLPNGDVLNGKITAHDMYTIIINHSIMIYKNNIGLIKPTTNESSLVFKNSIVATTL